MQIEVMKTSMRYGDKEPVGEPSFSRTCLAREGREQRLALLEAQGTFWLQDKSEVRRVTNFWVMRQIIAVWLGVSQCHSRNSTCSPGCLAGVACRFS